MKIALIAMAKNETPYAEEWLDYHFRLGVDDIYLVQHDGWRYEGKSFPGLHCHTATHAELQHEILNRWLDEYRHDYDWILFTDVDEYLCLKNGDNRLDDFFSRYDECNGVCFNWRYFGDGGHIEDGDYRVLARFTRCQETLSPVIKHALHTARAPENVHLANVHTLMIGQDVRETIVIPPGIYNVAKKHCQTVLCELDADLGECLNIAYLAHFRTKTYGEFIRRIDTNLDYFIHTQWAADIPLFYSRFYEYNHNETEELSLRNFQRTGRFLGDDNNIGF